MKLIVGLGNPGRKYEGTRHNVGFDVLDQLAKQHGCSHWKERFAGQTAEVRLGDVSCLLLKPLTMMNRSGRSVGQASRFFKLEAADVLIICDDFHLPLGRLRLRAKGSAGGQKGLADVLQVLKTEEFSRLRIGVGELPANWDAADFVLSRFNKNEQSEIAQAVDRAVNAVTDWVRSGIEYCQNQYNAG